MEDNQNKSLDFAADVTKQLIALSTGIISLCAAFTDNIFSKDEAKSHAAWLTWALVVFVFSILFGLLTQMKLTGMLAKGEAQNDNQAPIIYDKATTWFSRMQFLSFFVAVVLSLVFVFNSIGGVPEHKTPPPVEQRKPVTDTLLIKVECKCDSSTKNAVRRTIPNPCIKSVCINTCTDTIVPKMNVSDSLTRRK